ARALISGWGTLAISIARRSPLLSVRRQTSDQARASPIENVVIDPSQEYGDTIAKANQHRDMQGQPCEPGKKATEVECPDFTHRARFPDRRHRAVVGIVKSGIAQLTCRTTFGSHSL